MPGDLLCLASLKRRCFVEVAATLGGPLPAGAALAVSALAGALDLGRGPLQAGADLISFEFGDRPLVALGGFPAALAQPAGDHDPVVTDRAATYPIVLEELLPAAWHCTEQYANNRVEADHGRLKARLRPMQGLKQDRSARVIIAGHGFVQNLRRGLYELAAEERRNRPIVNLDRVRATVAGLDSIVWRDPDCYGTLLEHGGVLREEPLASEE